MENITCNDLPHLKLDREDAKPKQQLKTISNIKDACLYPCFGPILRERMWSVWSRVSLHIFIFNLSAWQGLFVNHTAWRHNYKSYCMTSHSFKSVKIKISLVRTFLQWNSFLGTRVALLNNNFHFELWKISQHFNFPN